MSFFSLSDDRKHFFVSRVGHFDKAIGVLNASKGDGRRTLFDELDVSYSSAKFLSYVHGNNIVAVFEHNVLIAAYCAQVRRFPRLSFFS